MMHHHQASLQRLQPHREQVAQKLFNHTFPTVTAGHTLASIHGPFNFQLFFRADKNHKMADASSMKQKMQRQINLLPPHSESSKSKRLVARLATRWAICDIAHKITKKLNSRFFFFLLLLATIK
jgi:hypothetical protein